MKKTRKKRGINFLRATVFLLLLTMLAGTLALFAPQEAKAATSYTNAKEFFDTCGDDYYHCEFAKDGFYYATKNKMAASKDRLRYATIGYTVTATNAEGSLSTSIEIGRDTNAYLVNKDEWTYIETIGSTKYQYNLYYISYEDICKLFDASKNMDTWRAINASKKVTFQFDAIMSTKPKGADNPVSEIIRDNGDGTVVYNNKNSVYHLNVPSEFNAISAKFGGYQFKTNRNIKQAVMNDELSIYYNANGGQVTTQRGYTVGSDGKILYGGSTYFDTGRRFREFTIGPADGKFGITKPGYKLTGWKNERVDSAGKTFLVGTLEDNSKFYGQTINPDVTKGTGRLCYTKLTAQWSPIKYKIQYKKSDTENIYSTVTTDASYDSDVFLEANSFQKNGYKFKNWYCPQTKQYYNDKDSVRNLTTTDGATVTMIAQWEPNVFPVTLNDMEGSGGMGKLFEFFELGFFFDEEGTSPVRDTASPNTGRPVTIPKLTGHNFTGYYTSPVGGMKVIGPDGVGINPPAPNVNYASFKDATTLYAQYEAMQFKITFDKQEGSGGSNGATATYGQALPGGLVPPTREGYRFMGYYTAKNGGGTCMYDEFMNPKFGYIFEELANQTYFAYWIDETAPVISLTTPAGWSSDRDGAPVYYSAKDSGSGLKLVELTRTDADGETVVVSLGAADLTGDKKYNFDSLYPHKIEGAYRYHLHVEDNAGNVKDTYGVVQYDITAPQGTDIELKDDDLTNVTIGGNVTDFVKNDLSDNGSSASSLSEEEAAEAVEEQTAQDDLAVAAIPFITAGCAFPV